MSQQIARVVVVPECVIVIGGEVARPALVRGGSWYLIRSETMLHFEEERSCHVNCALSVSNGSNRFSSVLYSISQIPRKQLRY